jgi:ethanolamine transporter EutH
VKGLLRGAGWLLVAAAFVITFLWWLGAALTISSKTGIGYSTDQSGHSYVSLFALAGLFVFAPITVLVGTLIASLNGVWIVVLAGVGSIALWFGGAALVGFGDR